jgi:mercuric ion binding protein
MIRKTLMAVLFTLPLAAIAGDSQTVVLDVQKMTCALCSVTVQKALEKVAGVATAKIDYDKKTATVRFDSEKVPPAVLMKATTDAGFPSKPSRRTETMSPADVAFESVLTYPTCGVSKLETMPAGAGWKDHWPCAALRLSGTGVLIGGVCFSAARLSTGSVKENVVPSPATDSAQMRPP